MDQFGKAVLGIILSAVLAILIVRAAEEIRDAVNHIGPASQEANQEVTSQ